MRCASTTGLLSERLLSLVAIVVLASFLLSACTSTGRKRRGKLSDAAEKASDDHKGSRKADTSPPKWWERDDEEEEEEDAQYTASLAEADQDTLTIPGLNVASADVKPPKTHDLIVGLRAGSGILGGDDFYGLQHLAFVFGGDIGGRFAAQFRAALSHSPIQKSSLLRASLKDGVRIAGLGGVIQWFTTPKHTFMGNYFQAGAAFNWMWWNYKNPILADVYDDFGNVIDTEIITYDMLKGVELFVGVGWHIYQCRSFQIGGEVSPGVTVWNGVTKEGFDNDVIEDFGFIRFSVLVNYGFKE